MSALSVELLVKIFGALHHGGVTGFECLLTERSLSALERTRDEARVYQYHACILLMFLVIEITDIVSYLILLCPITVTVFEAN